MNAPSFRAAPAAPLSIPPSSSSRVFLLFAFSALAALLPSARAQLYTEDRAVYGDPISDDRFGMRVALSADGNTLLVGTPSATPPAQNAAYVFVRDASGGWTRQQKLAVPAGDVAVDGDTLVAGGVTYVRSGSTWSAQGSVLVSHSDTVLRGDTLVVGSPFDRVQDNGRVEVYVRNGTGWTQQLAQGADAPHENMGDSVALDGDTLLVGTAATSPAGAYVYVRSGATWTRQARIAAPTGSGVLKVAVEANIAALGDPVNNRVHVFMRSGSDWALVQTIAAPAGSGSYFGYKVTLDGGILGVGDGPGTGFFLYSRTASGWVLAQTINRQYASYAGNAVLAANGKLFVVGNPGDGTNASSAGAVEAFSVPPPPLPGNGWRDDDIGAVGVAGGSTPSGSTIDVRGSGTDIWENADQFHFYTETMTGDGAIIARVDSAGTTHNWAKVGLMFREDVAPASRTVMTLVTPAGHLGMQVRSTTSDQTSFQDAGWAGAPIWLMLARSGNVFGAYRSDDGDNWTQIGAAMVTMPETIHVGLAVSSHDNGALNTGTFSGLEVLGLDPPPPPSDTLSGSYLGSVGVTASYTDEDGVMTIDAAGSDIWDQADSGYFVHREITGDFDIRARVGSLANTNPWAKAGVMVRESLAAGSRNIFTLVTAGNAAGMQVRAAANGSTFFNAGPWMNAPYWVRLVRTGNVFQSMISPDGATWQTVGTETLDLPATLHAGLAVSSHESNTATHATFSSVLIGD